MDLYRGMRILAFVSFTMGVTTFIVSGWTFITNRMAESHSPHQPGCNNTVPHGNTTDHYLISTVFKTTVLRSCIVVVFISVIQMASAAVILDAAVQGCRRRAQIWLGLNSGVNLVLLISLVVPMMYAEENKSRLHIWPSHNQRSSVVTTCDEGDGTQEVLHLASFYIALCLNFVIHFLSLIMSLMMLRYDENRDYELVALV